MAVKKSNSSAITKVRRQLIAKMKELGKVRDGLRDLESEVCALADDADEAGLSQSAKCSNTSFYRDNLNERDP